MKNPWLRENFKLNDYFDYRQPVDGTVLFTSLRNGPNGKQVFMVSHMEGGPIADIDPLQLPVPGLDGDGWHVALRTPSIGSDYLGGPITLRDSMGILYVR